jgi:hypothetical protein
MIFAFDVGASRLRMNTHPSFAFRLPLSAQIVRHGIGKSKCDEIHRALLLPMWQAVSSETDVGIQIEEAHVDHRNLSV